MVYPLGPKVAYIEDDVGVEFNYFIAGPSQNFFVTREALEEHFDLQAAEFNCPSDELAIWDAFHRGWERIRNVAARIRRAPTENRIVLKASDFEVK